MIIRILRTVLTGAALVLAFSAAPASAQALKQAQVKTIADSKDVTLDPAASYMLVTIQGVGPLSFIRLPDPDDVADYKRRRAEALAKAYKKWVKRHAEWVEQVQSRKDGMRVVAPGPEPVEPNDFNLRFPSIEFEGLISMGPLGRFAKGDKKSVFLTQLPPGRYVFYGLVNFLLPQGGTCMCMGSVAFELKPGQITNIGTVHFNFWEQREAAKAAGQPVPKTELDLPDGMSVARWEPATAGDTVDPRLASYTVVPAKLRGAGPFPNILGVAIDRLDPVPGVLGYERDAIIDLSK